MRPSNNEARSCPAQCSVVAAHTLLFCKLLKLTSVCLYGVLSSLMNGYDRVVMVTNVIYVDLQARNLGNGRFQPTFYFETVLRSYYGALVFE